MKSFAEAFHVVAQEINDNNDWNQWMLRHDVGRGWETTLTFGVTLTRVNHNDPT